MADSQETLDLRRRARRRLVGAVALVLALVIVPPWIMDLEPKQEATRLKVDIPSQDSAKLPPLTPPPQPAPQDKASAATKSEPMPADPSAAAQRKPEDPNRARAILNAEEFVVPLGSFAHAGNVKQLQARLGRAGVSSYTEVVKAGSSSQTRVRAGPFPSRDAAEQARDKIKGLGIDAGTVTARQ
jgi:DedD protein